MQSKDQPGKRALRQAQVFRLAMRKGVTRQNRSGYGVRPDGSEAARETFGVKQRTGGSSEVNRESQCEFHIGNG